MPANIHGRVLIIAGSDSGGGAGIQGDLKTVTALGGYGMTAITALTAQNTLGVFGIHPVPADFIAQQIEVCLSDIGADAIKTGMLHSAEVIEAVVEALERFYSTPLQSRLTENASLSARSPLAGEPNRAGDLVGGQGLSANTAHAERPPHGCANAHPAPPRGGSTQRISLIVDPVMVAKGGAALLQQEALRALKEKLIPRATLITPNLPEAELLLGCTIRGKAEMETAARDLLALGAPNVLLKGGHGEGEMLTDILVRCDGPPLHLTAPRIATRHTHGTGCSLASAIATGLAQKLTLEDAVRRAHAYVQDAIARAPGFGVGNGPLGH